MRKLVQNFLKNLGEFRNISGAIAELQGTKAARSSARLIINSTAGIGGLIDVLAASVLKEQYHDFGMTFAAWGISSGPLYHRPLHGSLYCEGAYWSHSCRSY